MSRSSQRKCDEIIARGPLPRNHAGRRSSQDDLKPRALAAMLAST